MLPKKDLNDSIQYLKGVGPRRAAVLAEHGLKTVRDLLYYFPYNYIDLRKVEKIGNLRQSMDSGNWITVIGTVRSFALVGRAPKQRFVVVLGDDSGTVQLIFFRSVNFFKKAFTAGDTLAAAG